MTFVITTALLALELLQNRYPRGYGREPVVNTQAVASFNGTLKSADKKWLILAVENGESLKMFVTSKTRFLRDGKAAKPADFHDGEAVVVDAERDVRLNMIAVKVEFPVKTPPEPK